MKYTIYKTTNIINGKKYIGKHQTYNIDDDYMGSGKLLKRAIKKYGIESFTKRILFVFDTEEEMNVKEAELVTEDFCNREDTYNLCSGGQGGFGYINANAKNNSNKDWDKIKIKTSKALKGRKCPNISKRLKLEHSIGIRKHGFPNWTGRTHTEESKLKIGKANSGLTGKKNSQFGTMWITDKKTNKKIKKDENIPQGWYKGRTIVL